MRFLRFAALLALFFFFVEVIHTSTPIFRELGRSVQSAKTKSSKNEAQKLSKSKKQHKIKATEEADDDSDFITACRATLPRTLPVFFPLIISKAPAPRQPTSPIQTERIVFRPPLLT